MTQAARSDPTSEIRITGLHSTRGLNFWSKRPVIRMDLVVGAFEDISSAQVDGFTDALVGAMPGLIEHRCSIGSRGGFVTCVCALLTADGPCPIANAGHLFPLVEARIAEVSLDLDGQTLTFLSDGGVENDGHL